MDPAGGDLYRRGADSDEKRGGFAGPGDAHRGDESVDAGGGGRGHPERRAGSGDSGWGGFSEEAVVAAGDVAASGEGLRGALWHGARLVRAGVPVRQGVGIVEARGASGLESVVAAKIDGEGRPVAGTERVYRIDCLAVGNGFAPNTELAGAAGCAMARSGVGGGWVVQVDDSMETTLDGIFAAGEITGIAGGKKSFLDGRMAGWSILRRRGEITERDYESRMAPLRRERARQIGWGRFLQDLCRVPDGAWRSVPDETIICRCEDVTAGDLRRKMAGGFDTFGALKKATRCGMGMCQGRTCGPILMGMPRASGGRVLPPDGPVPVRAPVKPVRLSALAGLDGP